VDFFRELKDSVIAKPKIYGALVGGMGGAVLLHKYFAGVCVTSEILSKLGLLGGACGCAQVGWLAALGFGALGGVFLILAAKAVYHAFGPEEVPELKNELSNSFQDGHKEIENLKNALLQCSDDELERELRRMAAFWDRFETFNADADDNVCPVCLEPPERPVLFRGCAGRHFHCFECRDKVLSERSLAARCTICREAPP